VARARKLFPIYGSTLANHIRVALVHDRMVPDFVAAYVKQHNRGGILGGPARDRELAETIGREIVLALIVETRNALPRFFGKQKISKLRPEEGAAVDAFFAELLGALERAQKWNSDDRRQFHRDLALYIDFGERRERPDRSRKKKNAWEEVPFTSRVALLLDPSMLEEARSAARKFHGDLEKLSQKLMKKTFVG
jgi:hypothetical protein